MAIFAPYGFYQQRVEAGAPPGPANAFRTDAYASSLVFATPGALFSDLGMTYAWSDVHADIKGSGTNKSVLTADLSADNTYNNFSGDDYASATEIVGNGKLRASDDTDFEFGAGDFTIEGWLNFANDTSRTRTLFSDFLLFNPTNIGVWFRTEANAVQVVYNVGTNQTFKNSGALSWNTGQWYHLALSRNSGNWYVFRDGTEVITSWSDARTINATTQPKYLMGYYNAAGDTVWMQDYRIYKGAGKYTGAFTPPQSMVYQP